MAVRILDFATKRVKPAQNRMVVGATSETGDDFHFLCNLRIHENPSFSIGDWRWACHLLKYITNGFIDRSSHNSPFEDSFFEPKKTATGTKRNSDAKWCWNARLKKCISQFQCLRIRLCGPELCQLPSHVFISIKIIRMRKKLQGFGAGQNRSAKK